MAKKRARKTGKPAGKQAKKTPAAKKTPVKRTQKRERLSQIDAAAKVLAKAGQPMNCKDMVAAMAEQGLWKSPGGKTPHATLAAALIRDLKRKDTRFRKADRGLFTLA